MAIRYGNLNGGGGGGLWKFNPTAPGTNIELDTSAGVTGIAAPLPGFPETNLLFQEVAPGVVIGGFLHYVTPTKFVISGVNAQTGAQVGTIAAVDINTGANAGKSSFFDGGGLPTIGGFVGDGADAYNEDTAGASNYTRSIGNTATLDGCEVEQSQDANEVRILLAGGEWLRVRIDSQGFKVVDPVAGDMFRVDETGKLYTNQTSAAGAPGAITDKLPLYAPNGLLVGYIPVYDSL